MNEGQKRRAIREFFTVPHPKLHPRTLIIGGCVLFLGVLSGLTGDGRSGFVLAGLGALFAVFLPLRPRARTGVAPEEEQAVSILSYPGARDRYRSRSSPDQVVAWLMEDIARIRDESKTRLRLDETTRDPICVIGPLYGEEVQGIDPGLVLRRRTPNGYLYSAYRITVFQFCEAFLGAYQCNFDSLRGRATAEETAELYYRDVVSVRTVTQPADQVLKTGETLMRATIFSLTAASGERIRIVLDDPAIEVENRIRTLGEEAADNIRAMLRQYKVPFQEPS